MVFLKDVSARELAMKRKSMVWMMLSAGMLFHAACPAAGLAVGPGKTGFWVGLTSPQQIDSQVSRLLADNASVVALRMPDDSVAAVRDRVATFKRQAPHTPLLMYAWASRDLTARGKPGGASLTDWIGQDSNMQVHAKSGRPLREFADVTNPDYQSKVARSIAAVVDGRGFDGVAIDLAVRTPRYSPMPIARICASDATFCTRYAEGMDATFAAIRKALNGRPVLYNGLWNLGPGAVDDQAQLLKNADAAAVEYFGGNFKASPSHSFSQDILPYLKTIANVPEEKKVLVFGRGSYAYTTYAEDYAWQRYLYCAYLLGARNNTYFKYHATFRTDVRIGRTGSLSVFSDAFANLGDPVKPYAIVSGLYSRPFAHGMVVVAPDDGHGGNYALPHAMYSPEGDKYEGRINLQPGQGMLLLDAKQPSVSDQHLLDLKLLADWPNATLSTQSTGPVLTMVGSGADGSHDMLLDAIRTPRPRNTLQLSIQPGAQTARLELMAEVDDPSHQTEFAILELKAAGATGAPSVAFRTRVEPRDGLSVVQGPALTPGTWQNLALNGQALFAKSGLTFRRWDYVRFDGAIKLQSVKLAN